MKKLVIIARKLMSSILSPNPQPPMTKNKTIKAWAVIDNRRSIVRITHKGVENFNVCPSEGDAEECVFNHERENKVVPVEIKILNK